MKKTRSKQIQEGLWGQLYGNRNNTVLAHTMHRSLSEFLKWNFRGYAATREMYSHLEIGPVLYYAVAKLVVFKD